MTKTAIFTTRWLVALKVEKRTDFLDPKNTGVSNTRHKIMRENLGFCLLIKKPKKGETHSRLWPAVSVQLFRI